MYNRTSVVDAVAVSDRVDVVRCHRTIMTLQSSFGSRELTETAQYSIDGHVSGVSTTQLQPAAALDKPTVNAVGLPMSSIRLTSSNQSLYALRVLRHHGLGEDGLWTVFRAVVVSRLIYVASAWIGFTILVQISSA